MVSVIQAIREYERVGATFRDALTARRAKKTVSTVWRRHG